MQLKNNESMKAKEEKTTTTKITTTTTTTKNNNNNNKKQLLKQRRHCQQHRKELFRRAAPHSPRCRKFLSGRISRFLLEASVRWKCWPSSKNGCDPARPLSVDLRRKTWVKGYKNNNNDDNNNNNNNNYNNNNNSDIGSTVKK